VHSQDSSRTRQPGPLGTSLPETFETLKDGNRTTRCDRSR
jgi:hypothetical protein